MKIPRFLVSDTRRHLVGAIAVAALLSAPAFAADIHHVQLAVSNATEAAKWYVEHLDCENIEGQPDAVDCGNAEVRFLVTRTVGGSPGTGINHIGFSYADLDEKMAELESVGVRGSGVRLQRFEDGSLVRKIPGVYETAHIFDPWGTRIQLVEDPDTLRFHHVQLSATDPQATLAFYAKVLGGRAAPLKGKLPGVRFGDVWLLASQHPEGEPASTESRAIESVAFSAEGLKKVARDMEAQGARFLRDPERPEGGRSKARRGFIAGPDNVRIAVVEPGWAGVATDIMTREGAVQPGQRQANYEAPETPWGEPDLQGIWTNNAAHGIPLERPEELSDRAELTAEEAEARRERGTLGSIWGYEREWRDTTLGYVNSAPSTQVAMVIDPPDGRIPPMTEHGKEMLAKTSRRTDYVNDPPAGPENLSMYVRCISRGLPGMMMPSIYNNGLQITQSPGFVAIQREMIHETRLIPTTPRPKLDEKLKLYLGDPHGRWEGDTLIVETDNFSGGTPYRGSGENLKLTERFRRVGPQTLEYTFTVQDDTVWTRPWTGRFTFERDDEQYELVEYACHEGNYGMTNILSGARARERKAAEAAADSSGNP